MHNSSHSSNSLPREELIEFLSSYFSQRSSFLAKVIRADLQSLPHLRNRHNPVILNGNGNGNHNSKKLSSGLPITNGNGNGNGKGKTNGVAAHNGNGNGKAKTNGIATHNGNGTASTNGKHHSNTAVIDREEVTQTANSRQDTPDVETVLVDLVVQQTGYPKEIVTPEAKLLDDLNLDSIKASELVTTAARKFGVVGTIDSSSLNNSTLQEIATVIRSAMPEEENTLSASTKQISASTESVQESVDLTQLLLKLVEEKTGFPQETLSLELRLLDDLNLDSIKAAEFIATAAKQFGIGGQIDASALANSTLADVAAVFEKAKNPEPKVNRAPAPVATAAKTPQASATNSQQSFNWVRNFAVEYVAQASAPQTTENWSQARVLVVADVVENPVVSALSNQLLGFGAQVEQVTYQQIFANEQSLPKDFSHYFAILPQTSSQEQRSPLPIKSMVERLQSIATIAKKDAHTCIAYVQFGGGRFGNDLQTIAPDVCCAAAFARSLHFERPDVRVRVVDLAPEIEASSAASLVIGEVSGNAPISTVGYDANLVRLVPQHRLQQPNSYTQRAISWSKDDVILVTGGAKGITAECALALAQFTGTKMALVGSSPAPKDGTNEITRTLERFAEQGLTCRYYSCDITNAEVVSQLVTKITDELGTITGVVHGAGLNKPRRVEQVKIDEAVVEVSPKLLGAYNLLQALAENPPKLLVAFSSIIGVTGMPGNAWYAFANESLALLFQDFANKYPTTQTISLAYSVWGEVGMGARMGSVKNLERMGIGAIPTQEGVDRFLKLFSYDPGVSQVVIAARLGGLDTWSPVNLPFSTGLRFVDQVLYVEPCVELVTRTRLSLERDLYVQDHVWRGSYLFPTVFGLEAMTQVTAYVTGQQQPAILRLEDISLRRPIVVHPTDGTEIELHAEVLEVNAYGETRVKVGIRTEQSGFTSDHFAATLVLGQPTQTAKTPLELGQPLDIEPLKDLYGDLLFQGTRFQRMGSIFSLNEKTSVFRSYVSSVTELVADSFAPGQDSYILLGDPYFRDVLLQSVQLTIPKHICLPVQIDQIELFPNPNAQESSRIVNVVLQKLEGREYISEVVAFDEQGYIVERITGYRLRILEEHPENPTAVELAAPEARDRSHLQKLFNTTFPGFGINQPTVNLAYAPQHEQQQKHSLVTQALQMLGLKPQEEVDFDFEAALASGKFTFKENSSNAIYLSLSGCDRYYLCTVGEHPQGCHIQPVLDQSEDDEISQLSNSYRPLLNQLIQQGDTTDTARTRIWSAVEAILNVTDQAQPNFRLVAKQKDAVLLASQTSSGDYYVITIPVKLTRPPQRMIAIVVSQSQEKTNSTERSSTLSIAKDNGPQEQPVFEQSFQVSLRESASISRHVYFSQYFNWVGKIRELPMKSIASQMLTDFQDGDWSLLTKTVSLRVVGEATAYDTIQARCWLGDVVGSAFATYIEFCKVLPNNSLERLAIAEVKATWVHKGSNGTASSQLFPKYFQEYLQEFGAKQPATLNLKQSTFPSLPILPASLSQLNSGNVIYHASSDDNRRGRLIKSELFQTTLEESNLVGNIYYSNYFIWQGRILDLFLYSVAPDYLLSSQSQGEMICLYSQMNYLREAMPFDKIRVLLYVESVSECGATFNLEFFRELQDGTTEKLHVGQQEVLWIKHLADGTPIATPWPQELFNALVETSAKPAAVLAL
ncbi:MAG: SDR family NAD(P)-dependent oxidoreductase [Fischerella sp. CENA71]|nr:SDR family NAD(P)-dependent oxidoreductase [Fischerella sp. CENA71]